MDCLKDDGKMVNLDVVMNRVKRNTITRRSDPH